MISLITARSQPPGWLLWTGWAVFVVLPGILLWAILNRGLALEGEIRRHHQEGMLLQEMQAYARELEPPTFLETRLSSCLQRVWQGPLAGGARLPALARESAPRKLRQALARRLGFPLWGMFWQGPEDGECWFDADPGWKPPVVRRAAREILRWASRSPGGLPGDGSSPADAGGAPDPEFARKKQRVLGFQRSLFGDVARAEWRPWRVMPALSSAFGGGRLFLFYAPFWQKTAGPRAVGAVQGPLLGGCLLVVRERDLGPRRLLSAVASRSLNPSLRRSWRVSSSRRGATGLRRGKETFALWSDSRGIHLKARPHPWFVGFLSSRGSFQVHPGAERLELCVSLPAARIQHPLAAWLPTIGRSLWLMAALGSAGFLSIALFGLSLPFRLGGKILVGSIIAGLLPVGLLCFGVAMQTSVERERNRDTVQHQLETRLALIERMLRNHLIGMSQSLAELQKTLQPAVGSTPQLIAALERSCVDLPIESVFVIGGDDREVFLSLGPSPPTDWGPERREISIAAGKAFLSGFKKGRVVTAKTFKVKGVDLELAGLGELLSRPGQIYEFKVGMKEELFAGLPIDNGSVVGLVLFRFSPGLILEEFFRRHRDLLSSLQGRFGDWDLRLAALRLEKPEGSRVIGSFFAPVALEMASSAGGCREGGPETLPAGSRREGGPETLPAGSRREGVPASESRILGSKLTRLADVSAMLGIGFSQSVENERSSGMMMTLPVPRYPCLLLGWAEKAAAPPWTASLAVGGGYALLLLSLVVLLLGQVFRTPMLELVRVAREVERGGYPEQIGTGGGDELGGLGTAFAEMVQGLRQRDELARFVSDEVLATVRSDNVEALEPGGELMEVTVLFAGLRGFRAWSADAPGEEVVEVLNGFLATGQAVFSRFGGSLDKLVEDTLMGVFRTRDGLPCHAARAVGAALALQRELAEVLPIGAGSFPTRPVCEIGLSSGVVVSGKIGSRHGSLDFSVIGNAVNLAARFKAQAKKAAQSGILVAPATIRALGGRIRIRFLERVSIKGRSRPFSLYEVLELMSGTDERTPVSGEAKTGRGWT